MRGKSCTNMCVLCSSALPLPAGTGGLCCCWVGQWQTWGSTYSEEGCNKTGRKKRISRDLPVASTKRTSVADASLIPAWLLRASLWLLCCRTHLLKHYFKVMHSQRWFCAPLETGDFIRVMWDEKMSCWHVSWWGKPCPVITAGCLAALRFGF